MIFKSATRTMTVAACVLLLASGLIAQEYTKVSESALTLELKADSVKVCEQSFLPLSMKITNRSNGTISFNMLDIWTNYAIDYTDVSGSKQGFSYLLWPGLKAEAERRQNEVVVLQPSEMYTSSFVLSLTDRRFFSKSGKYSVITFYRQTTRSNAAEFEIEQCQSKLDKD